MSDIESALKLAIAASKRKAPPQTRVFMATADGVVELQRRLLRRSVLTPFVLALLGELFA